jgi:hypothetical protein
LSRGCEKNFLNNFYCRKNYFHNFLFNYFFTLTNTYKIRKIEKYYIFNISSFNIKIQKNDDKSKGGVLPYWFLGIGETIKKGRRIKEVGGGAISLSKSVA